MQILFFLAQLLPLIQTGVVIKQLISDSTQLDGPCATNPAATLNKNHLNLGDTSINDLDKFMLFGWFKVDTMLTTASNLLFIIPNSADTSNQHLLAITLNEVAVATICVSADNCATLTIDNFNILFVLDFWAYVLAGVDITRGIIHLKIVASPDSVQIPEVYSKTINFNLIQPWTTLDQVTLKNKLANSFGYVPFCGTFTRVWWFAGYFYPDHSLNVDLQANKLLHWVGLDSGALVYALNEVNPLKNQGNYGGTDILKPVQDTDLGVGILYGKNQAITFTSSKDVFGQNFIISFWFKAHMDTLSPILPVFGRKNALQISILEMKLVYHQNPDGIDLLVTINRAFGQDHGHFDLQVDTFYHVTFVVFTHYNLRPAQSIFHLIVTPTLANYYVFSYMFYVDSSTDSFFLGDGDNVATWADGQVHLHDFRVYSGAFYKQEVESTYPLIGCNLYVGAVTPSCLVCHDQVYGETHTDTYKACAQSMSPGNSVGTYIYCPFGQVETKGGSPNCKDGTVYQCAYYSGTDCLKCIPPYTLVSKVCSLPTALSEQDLLLSDEPLVLPIRFCPIGIKECVYSQGTFDKAVSCEDKYYLDSNTCKACESSCLYCENETQCTQCDDTVFLTLDTKLCSNNCGLDFTDLVNQKCVVQCDTNVLFSLDNLVLSIKQCVAQCPLGYIVQGKTCVTTCPQKTYLKDGSCLACSPECILCTGPYSIQCSQCSKGYYLEVTKCDTVCDNKDLFRDDVTNTCISQCPAQGLFLLADKRCVLQCPTTPIFYAQFNSSCVTKCPERTYLDDSSYICVDCYNQCSSCKSGAVDDCTGCIAGYYLSGLECLETCTDPLYPYSDSVNNKCQSACPINSLKHQPSMSCLKNCPVGYFAYKGNCINSCPVGSFIYNSTCLTCAVECTLCVGRKESQCTECQIGFFLYNTTCYDVCPDKRPFANTVTQKCELLCPVGTITIVDQNKCQTTCPQPYIIDQDGKNCIQDCPLGQYKNMSSQCQECDPACKTCSGGDKSSCFECNQNYFLDGTDCRSDTCPIHPSYLRALYFWQCMETCVSGMYNVIAEQLCVPECPIELYKLEASCHTNCPVGYFGDSNSNECVMCATQCTQCFGASANECNTCVSGYLMQQTSCTLFCSTQYFRNDKDYKCQDDCPIEMLKDDDGAGVKSCVEQCPFMKFQHTDGLCYFICPSGLYGNSDNGQCTKCSLECSTCDGGTNENCITCAPQFFKNGDACIGDCPTGYFPQPSGCQACAFRCLTCDTNQYNCLECRGNRSNFPMCNCESGYFDDGITDLCQQCVDPCVKCASLTFCQTCPFNKTPPTCNCLRNPPIKSEWCVSCSVAFPNIAYISTLDRITITFDYLISFNSVAPYLYTNDNCQSIFQPETLQALGNVPTCQITPENHKVIAVKIDYGVTLNIGDSLSFNENSMIDISVDNCKSTFITKFLTTNVQAPADPISPQIYFDYPNTLVSHCLDIQIQISHQVGDGLRNFILGGWQIIDRQNLFKPEETLQDQAYQQHIYNVEQTLKLFNDNSSDYLYLSRKLLQMNSIYHFYLRYQNFLGTKASQDIFIQIGAENTPSVVIDLFEQGLYTAFDDIKIPIVITAYSCLNGASPTDSGGVYDVKLTIVDIVTGAVILTDTKSDDGKRKVNFLLGKHKASPGNNIKLNATISKSKEKIEAWNSMILKIQVTPIVATFITKDRVIGTNLKQLILTVDAYDPGVKDEQFQRTGILYSWRCVNSKKQQECLDQQAVGMQLGTAPTTTVDPVNLEVNSTYLFEVTITKDALTLIVSQEIVYTYQPIEELPFYPSPDSKINQVLKPYDLISIMYNPPNFNTWVLLLYDSDVKLFTKVEESTLRFRVFNFIQSFVGSDIVEIYYTGYEDWKRIQIEMPYNDYEIQVLQNDDLNEALITNYDISIAPKLPLLDVTGFRYQFFYYYQLTTLLDDISEFNVNNGFALSELQELNQISTVLPAPITNNTMYIVAMILGTKSSLAFSYKQVSVDARGITNQRKNIQPITKYLIGVDSLTPLQQLVKLSLSLSQIKSRDQLACSKNCEGKGSCITITNECMCDVSWYLTDCSGGEGDKIQMTSLTATLTQLIFNLTEQPSITQNQFYSNQLTQASSSLFQSHYFYNILAELPNVNKQITDILNFVDKQIIQLSKTMDANQLVQQEKLKQQQTTTKTGINFIVQQPQPSISQTDVNNLIYIITSLFQQNAAQYKQQSESAVPSAGSSAMLNAINSKLVLLWQKLMTFTQNYIEAGSDFMVMATPTVQVRMKRDFWSLLEGLIVNKVIGKDIQFESQDQRVKSAGSKLENSQRVLTELSQPDATTIYDYSITKYIFNPYRLENNFSYPYSGFPVYQMSLKEASSGIPFSNNFTNKYEFNISDAQINELNGFRQYNSSILVDNTNKDTNISATSEPIQNYVCVWRKETSKNWTLCESFNVSLKGNYSYLECTCSQLSPVTAFNDKQYVYQAEVIVYIWTMDIVNLFYALILLTIFWILSSLCGIWRDKRIFDTIIPQMSGFAKSQVNQENNENKKPQKVVNRNELANQVKLARKSRGRSFFLGNPSGLDQQGENQGMFLNGGIIDLMASNLEEARKKQLQASVQNVWGNQNQQNDEHLPNLSPQKNLNQLSADQTASPQAKSQTIVLRSRRKTRKLEDEEEDVTKRVEAPTTIAPNNNQVENQEDEEDEEARKRIILPESEHRCSQFHKNHSLLEIFFVFNKDVGRGYRFTFLYTRFLAMFAISGFLAMKGWDTIIIILLLLCLSLILRSLLIVLTGLLVTGRNDKKPSCCHTFCAYFVQTVILSFSLLSCVVFYFLLEPICYYDMLYSWMIALLLDIFILDIIIQVLLRGKDVINDYATRQAILKKREQEELALEQELKDQISDGEVEQEQEVTFNK